MKGARAAYLLRPTYWAWIRSEAERHGSDGCSAVMGFHVECCFEHDLSYRHAKDPRDAYRREREGEIDPWLHAKPITRAEADRRFRQCHQNRSKLGRYSPMAIYRWLGVKWGGQSAWDAHRQRERQPT